MSFDARRWTWLDAVAGAASVVLVFLVLQPWYSVRFTGCFGGACRGGNQLGEIQGTQAHGYLWVIAAAVAAIVVLLVLRALGRAAIFEFPSDRQLLACLAGLNLVLALIAFFTKPGLVHVPAGIPLPRSLSFLSAGWTFWAWLAVAAAAVALLAGILNLRRPATADEAAAHEGQRPLPAG